MKLIDMKCPSCCARLNIRAGSKIVRCEYCDSKFAIDDAEILDIFDSDEAEEEDDATASLPLAEYARKKCQDFLEDRPDAKEYFTNTPKIVRGLDIPSGEDVYLIHDDTLFKSGKNGFAITERGIYCRPMGEAVLFYSWDKFSSMAKPELQDSYVVCKGRRICYFTGSDDMKEEMLKLFGILYRHAHDAR
jgi:hypothetical protein